MLPRGCPELRRWEKGISPIAAFALRVSDHDCSKSVNWTYPLFPTVCATRSSLRPSPIPRMSHLVLRQPLHRPERPSPARVCCLQSVVCASVVCHLFPTEATRMLKVLDGVR